MLNMKLWPGENKKIGQTQGKSGLALIKGNKIQK